MSRLFGLTLLVVTFAGTANAEHRHHGHDVGVVAVTAPELDPASAFSGLTLMLGGLAVARARRGKQ